MVATWAPPLVQQGASGWRAIAVATISVLKECRALGFAASQRALPAEVPKGSTPSGSAVPPIRVGLAAAPKSSALCQLPTFSAASVLDTGCGEATLGGHRFGIRKRTSLCHAAARPSNASGECAPPSLERFAHRLRRDHKTVGGLAWTLCTCHFRRKGSPATSP